MTPDARRELRRISLWRSYLRPGCDAGREAARAELIALGFADDAGDGWIVLTAAGRARLDDAHRRELADLGYRRGIAGLKRIR